MLRRLDPEVWPERLQTGVILWLVTALVGAYILAPRVIGGFFWLFVPLVGALLWRFEGTRVRDIVSWTVPLGVSLFLAGLLPAPIWAVVPWLGLAALVAMMYVDPVRDAWLGLVAPGHYRRIRGPDRDVAHALWRFDQDAVRSIEQFSRDGNRRNLAERIDHIAGRARALPIASPSWASLRDGFVAWLAFIRATTSGHSPDPGRFAELEPRRGAYEAAFAALIAERSEPIGLPPRAPTGRRSSGAATVADGTSRIRADRSAIE